MIFIKWYSKRNIIYFFHPWRFMWQLLFDPNHSFFFSCTAVLDPRSPLAQPAKGCKGQPGLWLGNVRHSPFLCQSFLFWIWKSCLLWRSWKALQSPSYVSSRLTPLADKVRGLVRATDFLCDLHLNCLKEVLWNLKLTFCQPSFYLQQ